MNDFFEKLQAQKALVSVKEDMRKNPEKYTVEQAMEAEAKLKLINQELWNE